MYGAHEPKTIDSARMFIILTFAFFVERAELSEIIPLSMLSRYLQPEIQGACAQHCGWNQDMHAIESHDFSGQAVRNMVQIVER